MSQRQKKGSWEWVWWKYRGVILFFTLCSISISLSWKNVCGSSSIEPAWLLLMSWEITSNNLAAGYSNECDCGLLAWSPPPPPPQSISSTATCSIFIVFYMRKKYAVNWPRQKIISKNAISLHRNVKIFFCQLCFASPWYVLLEVGYIEDTFFCFFLVVVRPLPHLKSPLSLLLLPALCQIVDRV